MRSALPGPADYGVSWLRHPRRNSAALGLDLPTSAIADRLGVSDGTVRRWFAEAGLTPPSGSLKNRPRWALTPMERPTTDRLRQLYVNEGLSIAAVAQQLNSTTHLVRTWLLEDTIPIRPGGGRAGARRPGRVRKPPPPAAELGRLHEQDRLSLGELAGRYGVHPQTVSKCLTAAGLPGHLPLAVSDLQVAALYRTESIMASEIARRLGISSTQALAALHREGVELDPARHAAVNRAAGARRPGMMPPLPAELAEQAVRYYQDKGWSYRMIGEHLGVSGAKVRAELQRRASRPTLPGRSARRAVPREPRRRSTRCASCTWNPSGAPQRSRRSWIPPSMWYSPGTPTGCRSGRAAAPALPSPRPLR